MKRIFFYITILMMLFCPTVDCAAKADEPPYDKNEIYDEFSHGIQNQVEQLDINDINTYLENINREYGTTFDHSAREMIKKITQGDFSFNIKDLFGNLFTFFFKEVGLNLGLMGKIMILAVICGLLKNLQSSFSKSGITEITYYCCYIVIMVILVQSFSSVLDLSKTTIDNMVVFMQAIFPILITLLISMGGIASSSLFQPVMGLLVSGVGTFLKDLVLPLIFFTAILFLINNISPRIQISKLANLLKNICIWVLGIIFTIFVGVMAIQGIAASAFDGVSIRTAKFAIDTFIPVVGSMLSESIDTIIGCSLLVKNATGLIGLIILAFICLFPIIKVLAIIFIYKLVAALIQPISDERLVSCLNDISNIIVLLFITLAAVAFMFFITISLIIGAGNITVMMR
jgi:stage III sporulation protein AE